MNAERLLAHYECIVDAPDAIIRLRRFILDLAVCGKLVPQDASDEPASELLKRFATKKALLVKAGEIRKPKLLPPINRADIPVSDEISGWSWIRLGDASTLITKGSTPTSYGHAYTNTGVNFVKVESIKNCALQSENITSFISDHTNQFLARSQLACGDILFSIAGSIGTCAIVSQAILPANTNQALAIIRGTQSIFLSEFLLKSLLSSFASPIFEKARGGAMNNVSLDDIQNFIVPVPPIAEQHRIVSKVDELIALCDKLEAARAEREATRNRLTASSLACLNTPDPDSFQSDVRFALDALPALTSRADQIKQLRQTILNLAVRGMLVPQDPKDEPASELLNRITKEKERLVKKGEIKKEKSLDPITGESQPFNLPRNWSWVHLDVLSRLITKGSSPKWQGVNYVGSDEGILFITSENVGNQELRKLSDLKYVESRFRDIEPRSMLKRGDILMNLVGASIGRTAIYDLDFEANINQAVALIRLVEVSNGPLIQYLLQYFNSPTAIEFMLGSRVITAQPNMSLRDTREFPIPLPPLAEQHRIVAKVDELMALCDQLESNLTTATNIRSDLLDTLLAEAIAPKEALGASKQIDLHPS